MSEKIREEFESWLNDNGQLTMKEDDGEYSFQHTRFAWEAWQASRAALVVELPDEKGGRYLDSYQEGWNDAISSCEQRLDDAGVSYK